MRLRRVLTHRRLLRVALLAVVGLAGCAPGADLSPLPSAASKDFQLGIGDRIRIITFGEETLTGEFRIGDTGNIAIPLLGSMQAAGLSSAALGRAISTELASKGLFKNPSVSVEVVAYRPFFILGEVSKPGQYPSQPGMSVLTAVAVAGGFTYRAVESYAAIVREVGGKSIEGKVGRETLVEPGDTIMIFERRF